MPASKHYKTGEVELSYTEWPGDSPPIVAMHPVSGTRSSEFVGGRAGLRAYAYDHCGHGESARAPGAYTFVNYGRDAVAFLRGVVCEPALLIGHSLGAMTAIYAAANAPELVKAAFLAEPPLYSPETGLREEQRAPFTFMRDNAGRPVPELIEAGILPEYAEMAAKLDPGVMAMILDGSAFPGWDTDALLRRIECPVVLQHGDPDFQGMMATAIQEGELDRAAPLIHDCTVLGIAGTGHIPWANKPEEWNAALRSFIQQHSSA